MRDGFVAAGPFLVFRDGPGIFMVKLSHHRGVVKVAQSVFKKTRTLHKIVKGAAPDASLNFRGVF